MEHLIVASILKKELQFGKTRIPVVLILVMICFFTIIMIFNIIYLKRYYKLISYFERSHPKIYKQIRIKPSFISSGNKIKPLIDFAKHHEPLNDPKAEKMLADFIRFDQQSTWIGSAILIIGLLVIILCYAFT